MLRRVIKGFTHTFKPPPDMSAEKCSDLHVRAEMDDNNIVVSQSAWEPTPDELNLLNAGGSIILHVWGGQPPVALTVEAQEAT